MLKKILSKLDNRHLTSIFIIIKDNRTYIQTTYYKVMSSDALEEKNEAPTSSNNNMQGKCSQEL